MKKRYLTAEEVRSLPLNTRVKLVHKISDKVLADGLYVMERIHDGEIILFRPHGPKGATQYRISNSKDVGYVLEEES